MSSKAKARLLFTLTFWLLFSGLVWADLQQQGKMSVSIPVGAYGTKDTEQGQEVFVEQFGRLLVPGKPNLPSKIFALAIPPGAELVNVGFDAGQGVVLPGAYEISPAPLPRVIGQEDPLVYQAERTKYDQNYSSVYGSDEPYPQEVVEFVRTAGYRKYNLADVRVTPFSYRPQSGQLTYFPDIVVHVTYRFAKKDREIIVDNLARTEKVAREIILNYDQAQGWYSPAMATGKGLYDFVIITTAACTSSVMPLANWETTKGRNVKVVTTAWIEANYGGGYDLAENMRNFLRDKYPSGQWGIEDVLLVGHYDDVPMRRTWQDLGYGKPETDFYYAELSLPDDQSWDDDEDHQYGENSDPIDFYNEVNVGRIPWSSPSTVESICQKSVAYELSEDASFKKNILLLGAFFWEDTDCAVLMEAKVNQPWMSDWTMTRMYELGHTSYPMDYNLTWSNVRDVWSTGTFAFVDWAGHGSPTSSHVMYSKGSAFVTNSTCPYLNDDYPAIIFADACSNSDTDYLNIGQAMMQQGGVGFLGATKVAYGSGGWNDPNDGSSQSLDYFFTTYVTSGDYTQGESHQRALRDMYTNGLWYSTKYEMFEWGALWGNPGLDMASHAVLSILFPDGLPEYRDPGTPDTITVQIKEAGDTYVPGSGLLRYRFDGGTYLASPLTSLGGDLYQAVLPPAGCSDTPEYYFSIEGDSSGVLFSPGDAPATVYTAAMGELVILYSSDFESSSDWTQDPTHTASTGAFERIDPNPTSFQPGDDTTPDPGIYAWITAQNVNAGIDDVDGGISATRSPVIDLSGVSSAHLSMMYFHGQRDEGDDPGGDFFRIDLSNDGGSAFPVNLVYFGDVTTMANWRSLEVDLDKAIPLTDQMVIRVQASESPVDGDYVEGGIDDVFISRVECAGPPEAIDDLAIDLLEGDIYLWWTEPYSEGGVDSYVVYRSTSPGSLGDSLAGTTGIDYTDEGAAGNTGSNYYYTVKAVDGGGLKSGESNQVGEFDCGLINAPPE
jgi:hypothetical protein